MQGVVSAHVPAGYSADFLVGKLAKVPEVVRLQIPLNFGFKTLGKFGWWVIRIFGQRVEGKIG